MAGNILYLIILIIRTALLSYYLYKFIWSDKEKVEALYYGIWILILLA